MSLGRASVACYFDAVEEQRFEPGTVVAGKYEIVRKLGSGGMGIVLAVRHKELGELFALKLMLPAAAASSAARERFSREAKAAAKLKSEHVARATDFGFLPDDGPPYMVLELLSGQNLAERLTSGGLLDPTDIARFMLDACKALREAHEEGIIHRDLKPTNLFVVQKKDGTECLKVLDFGIAKTIAQDAGALTKTATTMGSPFYMSPEQMRSAKSADARSDIWSMGVTMYELATGTVPFVGETVTEVAILVIEAAVVSPKTHRADLPDAFVEIVMRCLQKNPLRRYADIDDLAEALAAFAGEKWTRLRPRDATVVDPTGAHTAIAASMAMANTDLDASGGDLSAASGASRSSGSSSSADTIAAAPLSVRSLSQSTPSSNTARSAPPSAADVQTPEKAPPTKRSPVWPLLVGAGAVALALTAGLISFGLQSGTKGSGAPSDAPAALDAAATQASSAEEPSESEATAYRDAVYAVLVSAKPKMQACFDAAASKSPGLSGDVTLAFEVTGTGVPTSFRVIPQDGLSDSAKKAFSGTTADCFTGVIANKKFPPGLYQRTHELTFAYPLEATPVAEKPSADRRALPTSNIGQKPELKAPSKPAMKQAPANDPPPNDPPPVWEYGSSNKKKK